MIISRRALFTLGAAIVATPALASPGAGAGALVVAGQSLSTPYSRPDVQEAFREELGEPWDVRSLGVGGTTALTWGNEARSWTVWRDDHLADGPVLTRALGLIERNPIFASQVWMLWSQGQTDGSVWRPELCTEEWFVKNYTAAVLYITRRLREAITRKWWTIPCLIQTMGWLRNPNTGEPFEYPGHALVRLAQAQMLAYHGDRYNLVPGAVQTPLTVLKDSVHPTPSEDCRYARLNALIIKRRMS